MSVIRAEAIVSAKDATGRVFAQIADKIKGVEQAAKAFSGVRMPDFANPNWGKGFQENLDRMGVSMRKQVQLAREFADLQRSIHPRNFPAGAFKTHEYFGALSQWKNLTIANLRQVRTESELTGRALSTLGRNALTVAGIVAPAYLAQRGVHAGATAAAELEREQARGWLAGQTPADQQKFKAAAVEYSERYQSIDQATVLARLKNLRSFFGPDKAIEMLDLDLRGLTVLQSLVGRDAAMSQFAQIYKGLDIIGKNERPADTKAFIDAFLKAQSVDPDIKAGDFMLAARYARSGGWALSNEFLGTILPTLMQEAGGAQIGTMLQQNIAQNLGNRIKKESLEYQTQAGLRDKDGNFVGRDLLLSNPYRWTQQYLPDAVRKRGLDPANINDLIEFSSKAFSNTRVADFFQKMLNGAPQIERMQKLYEQAQGISAAGDLRNRDPFVAKEGLFAQFRNLAAQLAEPLLPAATSAMNSFSDSIAALTRRLAENPLVNTAVSTGVAATGVAATGAAAWLLGRRFLPAGAAALLGPAALPLAKIIGFGAAAYGGYQLLSAAREAELKALADNPMPPVKSPLVPDHGFAGRNWLPQARRAPVLPESVQSPLRIGTDKPLFDLGPLPSVGNIPAKADVSGSIDVKSKIDVSLDDNLLRVRVQSIVEPMLKNFQINGPSTGTTGPLGRSMSEAEYHP